VYTRRFQPKFERTSLHTRSHVIQNDWFSSPFFFSLLYSRSKVNSLSYTHLVPVIRKQHLRLFKRDDFAQLSLTNWKIPRNYSTIRGERITAAVAVPPSFVTFPVIFPPNARYAQARKSRSFCRVTYTRVAFSFEKSSSLTTNIASKAFTRGRCLHIPAYVSTYTYIQIHTYAHIHVYKIHIA